MLDIAPRIRLAGAAKKFGSTIAVYPMDWAVEAGEFVVILGPSGCGKTTTLRMIAGLEKPSQGEVYLDGKDVTSLRPGERDMAFVFQEFTLYPHLSVLENVGFPLRAQGLSGEEAQRQATEILRKLALSSLSKSRPSKLSGGDQQRVSLARALVRKPKAFLMDEPLGNLDGGLREEMRETLRRMHNQSGATTLWVTHDQAEAMALADRILVMREGQIIQFAPPRQIYDFPADLFVADFVGSPGMNILSGRRQGQSITLAGLDMRMRIAEDRDLLAQNPTSEGECLLGIRPQSVMISETGAPCHVEHTEVLGSHNLVSLRYDLGFLKAWLPAGVRFRTGEKVRVQFLSTGCRWFAKDTGMALPWRTLEAVCLPIN